MLATTQPVTSSWPVSPFPEPHLVCQGPVGPICGREASSPRGGLPGCVRHGGWKQGAPWWSSVLCRDQLKWGNVGEERCVQRHWSGQEWSQVLSLRSSPPPTVSPRRFLVQGRPEGWCTAQGLGIVILGTLGHCDTVWPRASHLPSPLSSRAERKPSSQGCDPCPMRGRLGRACRE